MAYISINYADAMLQVAKLKNAAEQCEDAQNSVKKLRSEIAENWSGDAQAAFVNKINEWETENVRIEAELHEIARIIKKVAQELKEADESIAGSF